MSERPIIIRLDRAADLLDIPIQTLRDQRWRGEGIGALGFRLDGRVVFRMADLEAFLDEAEAADRKERTAEQ